jgi:tRNA threonylcarbamoyladenosine biosynthesis protein TsaB
VILLSIDTATAATAVGLALEGGKVLEARDDPAAGERPGHSTRLLPLAAELLARAGLRWGELDRIAVGVGPGTFTGLRVGIATAHGLAQSSGAELVGVSSLRALALAAPAEETVLAAIDARRGEVFLAGYHGGMEILAPRALAPDALADLLAEQYEPACAEGWLANGDGAIRYRDAFERAGARVPEDGALLHRVSAAALCRLGASAPVAQEPVLPDYVRAPDAAVAAAGALG